MQPSARRPGTADRPRQGPDHAAFPDAGYNETGIGTGTRIFTGMTSLALSAAVASNSPAGHHAGFQRHNLTDDLTASGETSTHMAATDALLRAGIQLQTVNAVVRNLRLQRIDIESDR